VSKSLYGLWRKLPANLKLRVERWWFERISAFDPGADFLFMNYGCANLDPQEERLALQARDEDHRYSIQLYHRVASCMNWQGLAGLEVGCGHGGGASYLMRYLKPKSLVALDLTANAIRFCTRQHSLQGLAFLRGNAEALPFPDNAFDVVFNIESSLLYKHIERFFDEVVRVLKPNGTFLYADYRRKRKVDRWYGQLKESGLQLLSEEDISANVAGALILDRERKQRLIDQYVPKILHGTFSDFAGLKDGNDDEARLFKNGKKVYLRFVLRK
jgi:ubiquinone/menaquinone biosynthesis C-methylase UbiE